jgi:hypothetical protein
MGRRKSSRPQQKRRSVMKLRRSGSVVILASVLVAGLAWAPCAAADEHVKGVIQTLGSDGTVTMRTDDATNVTIVLRD